MFKKTFFLVVVILSSFLLVSCVQTQKEAEVKEEGIFEITDKGILVKSEEDALAIEVVFSKEVELEANEGFLTYFDKNKAYIGKQEGISKNEKYLVIKDPEGYKYIESIKYVKEEDIFTSKTTRGTSDMQGLTVLDATGVVDRTKNLEVILNDSIPTSVTAIQFDLSIDSSIEVFETNHIQILDEKNVDNSRVVTVTTMTNNSPFIIRTKPTMKGNFTLDINNIKYATPEGTVTIDLVTNSGVFNVLGGIPGDFNEDGFVNLSDFSGLLNVYNSIIDDGRYNSNYDIGPIDKDGVFNNIAFIKNPDEKIDIIDFSVFVYNYGKELITPSEGNLPEGYNSYPENYSYEYDENKRVFEFEVYTLNDYVDEIDFLIVELYNYDGDNFIGSFTLDKSANNDYSDVSQKFAGVLEAPTSVIESNDWGESNVVPVYVRPDGVRSEIPGVVDLAFREDYFTRGYKLNRIETKHVIRYWEDEPLTTKNITVDFIKPFSNTSLEFSTLINLYGWGNEDYRKTVDSNSKDVSVEMLIPDLNRIKIPDVFYMDGVYQHNEEYMSVFAYNDFSKRIAENLNYNQPLSFEPIKKMTLEYVTTTATSNSFLGREKQEVEVYQIGDGYFADYNIYMQVKDNLMENYPELYVEDNHRWIGNIFGIDLNKDGSLDYSFYRDTSRSYLDFFAAGGPAYYIYDFDKDFNMIEIFEDGRAQDDYEGIGADWNSTLLVKSDNGQAIKVRIKDWEYIKENDPLVQLVYPDMQMPNGIDMVSLNTNYQNEFAVNGVEVINEISDFAINNIDRIFSESSIYMKLIESISRPLPDFDKDGITNYSTDTTYPGLVEFFALNSDDFLNELDYLVNNDNIRNILNIMKEMEKEDSEVYLNIYGSVVSDVLENKPELKTSILSNDYLVNNLGITEESLTQMASEISNEHVVLSPKGVSLFDTYLFGGKTIMEFLMSFDFSSVINNLNSYIVDGVFDNEKISQDFLNLANDDFVISKTEIAEFFGNVTMTNTSSYNDFLMSFTKFIESMENTKKAYFASDARDFSMNTTIPQEIVDFFSESFVEDRDVELEDIPIFDLSDGTNWEDFDLTFSLYNLKDFSNFENLSEYYPSFYFLTDEASQITGVDRIEFDETIFGVITDIWPYDSFIKIKTY